MYQQAIAEDANSWGSSGLRYNIHPVLWSMDSFSGATSISYGMLSTVEL